MSPRQFHQSHTNFERVDINCSKFSVKTEEEGKLLKMFYESSITMSPKSDTIVQKESYRSVSLMNKDAKPFTKYHKIEFSSVRKRSVCHD